MKATEYFFDVVLFANCEPVDGMSKFPSKWKSLLLNTSNNKNFFTLK